MFPGREVLPGGRSGRRGSVRHAVRSWGPRGRAWSRGGVAEAGRVGPGGAPRRRRAKVRDAPSVAPDGAAGGRGADDQDGFPEASAVAPPRAGSAGAAQPARPRCRPADRLPGGGTAPPTADGPGGRVRPLRRPCPAPVPPWARPVVGRGSSSAVGITTVIGVLAAALAFVLPKPDEPRTRSSRFAWRPPTSATRPLHPVVGRAGTGRLHDGHDLAEAEGGTRRGHGDVGLHERRHRRAVRLGRRRGPDGGAPGQALKAALAKDRTADPGVGICRWASTSGSSRCDHRPASAPVVLGRDTLLTNSSYRQGAGRWFAAILQAGTPVYVDACGARVKCSCGNPLAGHAGRRPRGRGVPRPGSGSRASRGRLRSRSVTLVRPAPARIERFATVDVATRQEGDGARRGRTPRHRPRRPPLCPTTRAWRSWPTMAGAPPSSIIPWPRPSRRRPRRARVPGPADHRARPVRPVLRARRHAAGHGRRSHDLVPGTRREGPQPRWSPPTRRRPRGPASWPRGRSATTTCRLRPRRTTP